MMEECLGKSAIYLFSKTFGDSSKAEIKAVSKVVIKAGGTFIDDNKI